MVILSSKQTHIRKQPKSIEYNQFAKFQFVEFVKLLFPFMLNSMGYEKNEQGYELFGRGTKLYQNSRPKT